MTPSILNIGRAEAEMSLSEIAALWGVSRQRVHEIEQKALRKIRVAVLADAELRQMAIDSGCSLQPTKASCDG